MAEVALIDLFPNAVQDANQIVIPKSDLLGLVADNENQADQITVAWLKALLVKYTQLHRDANPECSIVVKEGDRPVTETSYNQGQEIESFIIRTIEVKLYQPYIAAELNPSDY